MQADKVSGFIRIIFLMAYIAVFAGLYVVLSSNNRPAGDDFEFLNLVRNYGWWNAMVQYWQAWNSRWLALLSLNTVLTAYNSLHSFSVYHIITLLALSAALYRFLDKFFLAINFGMDEISSFFFSSLVFILFFFLSFEISESFFWINANPMYLWSVIFIILGFSEFLKEKYSFKSYLIIAASFFYVGGAFESYAVVVLLALVAALVYELRRKQKNTARIKLLLASVFFLCASFSIALMGTGWRNRHEILGTPTLASSILVTIKAMVKMFIWYIPAKIHWMILFFLVCMGIGSRTIYQFSFRKNFLLYLFITFCISTFIILFPSCYLLRETPPFRSWTLICFLLALTVALAGIFTGQKFAGNKSVSHLSTAATFFIFLLVLKTFIEQKNITGQYASAFDAREKILLHAKLADKEGVIELEPLPPSGMLYSAEITADTAHFRNIHLKDYYQLKASVRVKPVQQ